MTRPLTKAEKSHRKFLRDEARREFKKRTPSEQLRARLRAAGRAGAAAKFRGLDGWPPRARDPERAMEQALAGRRYDRAATW